MLGRPLAILALAALGACGPSYKDGPPAPSEAQIAELADAILDLGPNVDEDEAKRAARISYEYPLRLAEEYGITDPPIVHNMKVNNGSRPRGLCWHWAEDMESRLGHENFQTLTIHRAIAPPSSFLRLEHSTSVISARGDTMFDGIVVDPWRYGGKLFWSKVLEDDRYNWRTRREVLAARGQVRTLPPGAEPAGL